MSSATFSDANPINGLLTPNAAAGLTRKSSFRCNFGKGGTASESADGSQCSSVVSSTICCSLAYRRWCAGQLLRTQDRVRDALLGDQSGGHVLLLGCL